MHKGEVCVMFLSLHCVCVWFWYNFAQFYLQGKVDIKGKITV